MQDRFSRIVIFLIIVLSILHSGEALKCYVCLGNTTCNNKPFEEMECGGKLCANFTVDYGLSVATGRTCADTNFCEITKQFRYFKNCKECSTDLCNTSANNAVSTITIITLGMITLLRTIQ